MFRHVEDVARQFLLRMDGAASPPGGQPPNPNQPNPPFALGHAPHGGNPFRNLNRRVVPQGMDREDRQGVNGELLFVQADPPTVVRTVNAFEGNPPPPPTPPAGEEYYENGVGTDRSIQVMAEPEAVADIRDRFNRRPPDPNNYTGVRRWFLERPVVQRVIVGSERSRTWQEVLGAVVLAGLIVFGGTLAVEAIAQAQNAPQITRVNLDPLHCYNAPENSIALGYNLSVDGQTLGSDPHTGIVVLLEPDQNPLTQTRKVCSGNQPAAIDIVQGGDDTTLRSTYATDILSMQQNGCVDNKGCTNVIPLRR